MNSFQDVQRIQTDLLIIGGGVAGMMAAVGAVRSGVKPMLLTKGTFPSGSSSMARGGHTIAIGHAVPEDKPEFLYEDSVKASLGTCNQRLMRVMSHEAIDRTLELDEWGLGLIRVEENSAKFDQKPSGSHRYPRLVHCGDLMGKPLMASLSKKVREWGIVPEAHLMLVDLLREDGRVIGAWGFRHREGIPVVIHAGATVLATGGAPQLHELNDSPPTITGDGYAMAMRAGAELIDMEFIDYQLLAAAPARIAGYPPHTSGFIHKGAYLLNKDKERFMKNYDPENWERSTRAMINSTVAREIFEGRGTENNAIYLDARHMLHEVNDGATAAIIRVFKTSGVDMAKEPIEVTSGPHTYLGGVLIDEWGRTGLKGLYAGGEAAGGIHGANRTGGAALADSYVFGFRSGMAAARELPLHGKPDSKAGSWRGEIEKLEAHLGRTEGPPPDEWRREVQQLVVTCIGQVRHGDRLEEGLRKLDEFEERFDEVAVLGDTLRARFNCLRRTLETRNLIQVARMLGTAALFREESRGGHFRLDFPELDDENWKCNIVMREEGGCLSLRKRAVVEETEVAPDPPGAGSTAAVHEKN
ncbi:MAG: FAD-binding protein [bacterium]